MSLTASRRRSPMPEEVTTLRERQAAFLRKMDGAGAAPVGMDATRVELQARQLRRKRLHTLRKRHAPLADALGAHFASLAVQWLEECGWAGGVGFPDWLATQPIPPDAAIIALRLRARGRTVALLTQKTTEGNIRALVILGRMLHR